jgi:site-specific recombinase XerD
MLFDFLVVRQMVSSNPAHAVRGPKYVVKKGKTPVWSREDARTLLDSIPKDSLSGLRDRALIAAMLYSFARVSAVLKLKVDDYYHNGARRWLRLHEKGGKEHEMPVHHLLEESIWQRSNASRPTLWDSNPSPSYLLEYFSCPKSNSGGRSRLIGFLSLGALGWLVAHLHFGSETPLLTCLP